MTTNLDELLERSTDLLSKCIAAREKTRLIYERALEQERQANTTFFAILAEVERRKTP